MLQTIKDSYFKNLSEFNQVYRYTQKLQSIVSFTSEKLKSASSRITIPQPFEPFLKHVDEHNPSLIKEHKQVTVDEVRASDYDCFKRYDDHKLNPKPSIDIDLFIKSGVQSAVDMGIIHDTKHKVISAEESLSHFTDDTNSAWPLFGRKVDPEVRQYTLNFVEQYLRSPTLYKLLTQPTTVFHRFQSKNVLGKIKTKIRQVWGEAFSMNILTGMFFRDMINNVKSKVQSDSYPCTTYGRSIIDISDNIITPWRRVVRKFCSIDILLFDSNIKAYFFALFFAICSQCIQFPNRKLLKIFKQVCFYLCYTPYCYRSTDLRFQLGGNSSGTVITSLFSTWVTRTVTNYAYYKCTGSFAHCNAVNLGDDNIIRLDHKGLTLPAVVAVFEEFDLTIREDQCIEYDLLFDKDFQFLGYLWDEENRPTQSVEWFVVHFIYPQRFFRNLDVPPKLMHVYRAICIAASLYKGMDIFYEYIGKYDYIYRYLLEASKSRENVIIYYYGEDQRFNGIGLPLFKIRKYGWRYYDDVIAESESPSQKVKYIYNVNTDTFTQSAIENDFSG